MCNSFLKLLLKNISTVGTKKNWRLHVVIAKITSSVRSFALKQEAVSRMRCRLNGVRTLGEVLRWKEGLECLV